MREIIGNTKESEKGFKRNCRSYLLQETPRYKTTATTKETLIKKVLICCVALYIHMIMSGIITFITSLIDSLRR